MKFERKLIYALDDQNNLVSIDNVERGLNCYCHCPSCGGELVAKKGNIKIHHFSHKGKDNCLYAYQTSIHLLAKRIIEEGIDLVLPPVIDDSEINKHINYLINNSYLNKLKKSYASDLDKANDLHSLLRNKIDFFYKSYKVKPDTVFCEKKIDDYIPDILLEYKGIQLLVEIYVTHPVDGIKKNKIIKSGISTIEFDLSKIDREINEVILRHELSSGKKCYWIYNKLIETKTKKAIEIIDSEFSNYIVNIKEKELLAIKRYGGVNKNYKVYTLNSFDDYIFNPPCKSKVEKYCNKNGNTSKIKNIAGCERCIFFLKFDNGYLYCQRDPSK